VASNGGGGAASKEAGLCLLAPVLALALGRGDALETLSLDDISSPVLRHWAPGPGPQVLPNSCLWRRVPDEVRADVISMALLLRT
jgi:hypothetical protein